MFLRISHHPNAPRYTSNSTPGPSKYTDTTSNRTWHLRPQLLRKIPQIGSRHPPQHLLLVPIHRGLRRHRVPPTPRLHLNKAQTRPVPPDQVNIPPQLRALPPSGHNRIAHLPQMKQRLPLASLSRRQMRRPVSSGPPSPGQRVHPPHRPNLKTNPRSASSPRRHLGFHPLPMRREFVRLRSTVRLPINLRERTSSSAPIQQPVRVRVENLVIRTGRLGFVRATVAFSE